jgi:hypothetical protein
MENYDDEIPSVENGNWVNEKGEGIDIGKDYVHGKFRVTPDSLKENGKFISEDGFKVDIVLLDFDVPLTIKGGPYETQNVMVILDAKKFYTICPHCKKRILDKGMILVLDQFHIYPALCCNNMVWIRNGGSKNFLNNLI